MGRKIRYDLGEPDERNVTPLTLKLRIALEPLDTGGDGNIAIVKARGMEFKCVHFPPAEFDVFKVRFRREVPFLWSRKVFILPPEPGHDFSLPPADYKRFVYPGHVRFDPVIDAGSRSSSTRPIPTIASPCSSARPASRASPPSPSRRRRPGAPTACSIPRTSTCGCSRTP
jgi:hypothetical protein